MLIPVDIWLREKDQSTTTTIDGIAREPKDWTDDDVRAVLTGMLEQMHRLRHPDTDPRVVLRGLSWIVNPYEEGGVVIAIEIGLGAAVAGPFDVDQRTLEQMVKRVLAPQMLPPNSTVH